MGSTSNRTTFIFEEWSRLADSDPEAFEKQREQIIAQAIATAPSTYRRRLEGLQWQIDIERERSSNPISACVRISKMMFNSVYGDNGLVSALNCQAKAQPMVMGPPAEIININSTPARNSEI